MLARNTLFEYLLRFIMLSRELQCCLGHTSIVVVSLAVGSCFVCDLIVVITFCFLSPKIP